MKKLFILTATLVFSVFVIAQQNENIPEPEFINQVFYLDKGNKLQKLEKAEAEIKTKTKMVGMGGSKQLYQVPGEHSTVSFPAEELMLVVSTGGGGFGSDPSAQFELVKMESKKGNREAVAGVYNASPNKKSKETSSQLALNVKKLKEGVYGLVPDKILEKGEYAVINKLSAQPAGMTMKMDAFAFAVQ